MRGDFNLRGDECVYSCVGAPLHYFILLILFVRACGEDDTFYAAEGGAELLELFLAFTGIYFAVVYDVPVVVFVGGDECYGVVRTVNEFEKYGIPSLRVRVAISEDMGGDADMDSEIRQRMASPDNRFISDCINAIIFLHEKGRDVTDYFVLMSEYFRSGTEMGRNEIIMGINYLSKSLLTKDNAVRMNILLGLKRIFSATMIAETDEELEVNRKMSLRKNVAPIVRRLSDEMAAEHNEILLDWQQYYNSEETCLDIRNAFQPSYSD